MRSLRLLPQTERLEIAVLVELYDAFSKSKDEQSMDESALVQCLDIGLGQGILGPLLAASNRSGYFERWTDGDGFAHFSLADRGIALLLSHQTSPIFEIAAYLRDGGDWVLGLESPFIEDIPETPPADLDTWEPLPIDRSTAEYEAAVDSAQAALSEIESNNGYAASEPDERNGIVESIRGVLKTIQDGIPTKNQIVSGLLAPLKYVAKKFADASMGETAKHAVVAIIKWLSGLLS